MKLKDLLNFTTQVAVAEADGQRLCSRGAHILVGKERGRSKTQILEEQSRWW